jgi:energy-converting hydrogenase A subunit L
MRTAGLFMVALVAGMRPGYGRYETLTGAILALLIWLISGTLGW